jgi:uncharacterized protein
MIRPVITAVYAALLASLFLSLAVRAAYLRWRETDYLGQSSPRLTRAVRAHANLAEYGPVSLLLMLLAELLAAPRFALHVLGTTLVVARVIHAAGILRDPEPIWWRVVGFTLTCAMIGAAVLMIARSLLA